MNETRSTPRKPTPRADTTAGRRALNRAAGMSASERISSGRDTADHTARKPSGPIERFSYNPETTPRLLTLLVAALLVLALLALLITRCAGPGRSSDLANGGNSFAGQEGNGVSFCAVGDNLMNTNLLEIADAWAGETGDGNFNFSPFYEHIKDITSSYDLSFINQETVLGGTEEYNYSGYPSYNTPDSVATAIQDAGFDIVNLNTNHTYDYWVGAIEHAQEVWASHSDILAIGSYPDQQERERVHYVERNGIKVAFLSYSYGQNGYEPDDLPNTYYAVPINHEELITDVNRAKIQADIVVVYLHAGTEYSNMPNEEQQEFAQWCADEGVDLLIGSHAHVIQPMEWITRESPEAGGDSNPELEGSQMLAVYGLGDFVSGYESGPDYILSGMFTCNFSIEDNEVLVEDPAWHVVIEHHELAFAEDDKGNRSEYIEHYVELGENYTEEQAQANELLASLDEPFEWIYSKTREVIGEDFEIV